MCINRYDNIVPSEDRCVCSRYVANKERGKDRCVTGVSGLHAWRGGKGEHDDYSWSKLV